MADQGLRRLHPATVLLEIPTTILKWLWPIVAVGFLFGGGSSSSNLAEWAMLGIGLGAVGTLFKYFTLRYGIQGDRLVLRVGLIWSVDRTIPLAKIQNVDLASGPIQRLFRVTTITIETAGGDETEASLSVVSETVAERFRNDLLEGRGDAPGPLTRAEGDLIRRLTIQELLLAGATENRVGVIVVALFGLVELFGEGRLDLMTPIEVSLERLAGIGAWATGVLIAGAVVAFIGAGWILSIFLTAMKYHAFEIRRSGEGVRRRHGLLSKYESLVRRDRLQVFLVEANLLRRLIGFVTLKVQTAGAGDEGGTASNVFFPLLPRAESDGLVRLVFPNADFDLASLRPVHPLAARRIFLRLSLLSSLLTGAVFLFSEDLRALAIAPVGIALAWILRGPQYRALKWNLTDAYVIARAGLVTRRLWIVPRRRIQTVSLHQTPFQRRLGLATVEVQTAGTASWSNARIVDLGENDAREVFDTLAASAATLGAAAV